MASSLAYPVLTYWKAIDWQVACLAYDVASPTIPVYYIERLRVPYRLRIQPITE